jgi:hypothetical protein
MYRAFSRPVSVRPVVSAVLSIAALTALPVTSAQAQILLNGGFENPVVSPGSFQLYGAGQSIGAWTVVGAQVEVLHRDYSEPMNGVSFFNAQEGSNSLDLTGAGQTGMTSGVEQRITTNPGQSYTISFFVGRAVSSNGSAFYSDPAVADLRIDNGARLSFTNANVAPVGQVSWQQFSYEFTATGSSTLITFLNGTNSNNVNHVGLDNVSVTTTATATAPEPGTLALLGIVALPAGIAAVRKRFS